MKRLLRIAALGAATLVVLDVGLTCTVLRDGVVRGNHVAPHDPPVFTARQRATLTTLRAVATGEPGALDPRPFDARCGWAPRPGTSGDYGTFDDAGCRFADARFPRPRIPGVRRVVALGGAFTMGVEVEPGEAWPALVDAARADLEVANLGVGGYGVGQMLLRFERDGLPLEPDEVWVGFYPGGAWRATTHFLPLVHHGSPIFAFKPRFELVGEHVVLVPNPSDSLATSVRLLSDQRAFLDAVGATDMWVRRTPAAFAPRGSSLLHRSSLYRLALTRREDGGRDPSGPLFEPSSELHRTMAALVARFDELATEHGATLRVLVLPSRVDLRRPARGGRSFWTPLIEALRARGVPVADAGPALEALGGAADDSLWTDNAHYSPRGQRTVAEAALAAWP